MAEQGNVLARIVERKRADVAERERRTPLASLRASAPPTSRSLRRALSAPGARFVLECKKASPSEGLIRPDFDPHAVAAAYYGVADAVSVLTDEPFFQGSFEILQAVRAVVDVPILCKDFVVTPYQVIEARAHGADAILLMLSVLDDATALLCLGAAEALGMDCLVEVHDEAELERALALPAPVIGINNRDLKSLKVDLAVSERLAPRVPRDRIVIAESGVESRAHVERLAPSVDGFLVGTSLMRSPDIADAARALVTGRVKICGLTRPGDAREAERLGARFGGLVFAETSPRRVTREQAEIVVATAAGLPFVGVFLNQSVDFVADTARAIGLRAVQLHGDEDAAFIEALRRALPEGCEVWKAVPMAPSGEAASAAGEAGAGAEVERSADRLVFDTRTAEARGGTGRTFAWSAIDGHPARARSLLAGGLNPDNIAAARRVGTWGLDVASGVERAPGEKCADLLVRLFDSARGPSRHDIDPAAPADRASP
ncbi:bifunctional indole-3-glycerol-phosphate synthase TrpC/phosphoribosylanthranilate isomerase TrpF [Sorangium atrum]|uniref:Multifunctional fusion protein n=1 Tax=Sorangium atrum TaxID=2995308 RepID=A0ABT5C8A0_9BACT|nr:bifunctional indole-3-glycerol-phosphate synthase TrpC/phosphoribosylanthranilate isomerase TrpF [Sorangium aterium]MDC0682610.1 bifunctional indole-3-glycerol-phosphate synthase TrpC/phosphoribosylanthranilate isomerase TrpF [Sorangium aterium]